MANCRGNCTGNCGNCSGCARELTLTQGELDFLNLLAQVPFLPVGRTMGDLTPIYREDPEKAEENSLILQCLEKKGLISLDYDKPMANVCDDWYTACPIPGSMALTQRGQQVLELLEYQGAQ